MGEKRNLTCKIHVDIRARLIQATQSKVDTRFKGKYFYSARIWEMEMVLFVVASFFVVSSQNTVFDIG